MIKINLLPPSERLVRWPWRRLLLIIIGILFVFFSSLYSHNLYSIWIWSNQLKATRQQYSLLRPTQDKMELASLKLAEIDKRKTLLLKLTNERKSCYAILAGLGTIVPPEIKLTGMETLGKDVILIKGIAEKYPDLAKFMQLMEQNESNIFIQPILIKAETDTTTSSISSIATKFELNIKLKGL